jgi:hypothetical protein
MGKLEEQYKTTNNRMAFQDEVGKAVSEYSSCTENCRELLPVK